MKMGQAPNQPEIDQDPEEEVVEKRPYNHLERPFLLITVAIVSLIFGFMVRDFLIALLLAGIFAGMGYPLYERALPWVGKRWVASALIVVAMLLVILGPLAAFLGVVAAEALQVRDAVQPWIARLEQPDQLRLLFERIPFIDSLPIDKRLFFDEGRIAGWIGSAVSWVGSFAASNLAGFTQTTASFLLDVFVMLYAVFFFLLEGPLLLDRILYYMPLRSDDEAVLVGRFLSVTRATIKGTLVIGFLQGSLAGLGFWLADLPGSAFWGTVMMVLSTIPGVGAPLIWVPAVVWLFATGETVTATLLMLWCGAIVGTLDNVLRPKLVGADAEMSDLLILLSTLGGISMFGAIGVLIGPIVAALFVAIWELYGREYSDVLPPTAM